MHSYYVFFCKQKTAYEVLISDWSSDLCYSDRLAGGVLLVLVGGVEVAGVCRGDQTDLVALGCHGVLLRPFRRGRAGRPGRRRCRSCRRCAWRLRKRAVSPNGSHWRPRSGARAGWGGNGGGVCCWRARRSEERCVGNEGGSLCRSRWGPYLVNKKVD